MIMFKWENRFSMETILHAEYNFDEDVNYVIKVNNQYYAKVENYKYEINIKLTKKEDKIAKMTCTCNSGKRNCEHLAETLFYIEKYQITEKTFKHNSLTKYSKLSDVQFEKYLEKDIKNIDENELREFLINILIDNKEIYKNYISSFKDELSETDVDIILKKLNNILKYDIGVTLANDKFYEPITSFLNNEMIEYASHDEISYKIYMKIYEKIISTKVLLDSHDYSLILENINSEIISKLKTIKTEDKQYITTELENMIKNYPDNLFAIQLKELIQKVSPLNNAPISINLLKQQILVSNSYEEDEEYLSQIVELMKENKSSDQEIINTLEEYTDNFYTIQLLIPYYIKTNTEYKALKLLENYINESSVYDTNRPIALIELKNLHYKLTNMSMYTFLVTQLIREYNYYNEDDFDILKNESSDWNNIKQEIIDTYQIISSINLCKFYLYNDMTQKFEEKIFQHPNIELLTEFKDILIKKSPEKLRNAYEEIIYELLRVAKRSKYRKVAKILKLIKELPNSQYHIRRIKKDLKREYPQRKALFDEINDIK
ncbi:MAG: hypothetical protein E7Z84_04195 [Methanosphaera stadtmanae]|nr:hypothetical protein [Methanosphaera stadtmanae]